MQMRTGVLAGEHVRAAIEFESVGAFMSKRADQDLVFQSTDLAQWAERVEPAQVHALIRTYGVEECSALLQYLAPEKIQAVLDLDVWHRTSDSRHETFDKVQFLCWLKALLEGGTDFIIDTLVALGPEFCAGVFAHFLDQTPMEIFALRRMESGLATEDKDLEHGDPLELGIYGGSYVRLQDDAALDEVEEVFLELLGAFEEHAPEFLQGTFQLMFRSEKNKYLHEDLAWDRVGRMEAQGYTPSHKAREFLLRFRSETGLKRFHGPSRDGVWKAHEATELLQFLRENSPFGSGDPEQGSLLVQEPEKVQLFPLNRLLFEWASNRSYREQSSCQEEMAWLGNLFAGGWQIAGNPLKPKTAVKITHSTLELGLHCWMQMATDAATPADQPLCVVDLFERGWHFLYRNVSLRAARVLDGRLKSRNEGNGELREIWFRACSRRRLKEFGMERWIREGRYTMVREILEELEYALPTEAAFFARLLLDDSPRIPVTLAQEHSGEKLKQKAKLISKPEQIIEPLLRLKEALLDFSE
jgi:hypothetical protein